MSSVAPLQMTATLPFAGLTVLDVSTFIAAPAAAAVLGDYGANVIKIEQPDGGDPNRGAVGFAAYPDSPVDYAWQMDSRNKRSLALDLKNPLAHAVLERLVARADVLITNFPIPVRERLRLRYADLQPFNPRLVYASLTGYGEAGPDRDQPGFDTAAYFARTGWFDTQRYEDQPPHFSLPASGDRATAIALVSAIMMGLYQRERSGKGSMVGTSLAAAGLWSNGVHAQAALVGAYLPPRPPRDRPRSALANSYCTRDGRWFQLVLAAEERAWPGLCRAIGQPLLEQHAHFATTPARRSNAVELTGILERAFGSNDWAYWKETLRAEQVIFGAIARMQDIPEDAQLRAAGAIVETAMPSMPLTIAAPVQLDFAAPRTAQRAPQLGEHSDEILREAAFDAAQIAALRAAGVVS